MEAKDRASLKNRRRTAFHEAAHFVVGWYVRRAWSSADIVDAGGREGQVRRFGRYARYLTAGRDAGLRDARALLAGFIAESILCPVTATKELRDKRRVDGWGVDVEAVNEILASYIQERDREATYKRLLDQTMARVLVLWPAIESIAGVLLSERRIYRRSGEALIHAALPDRAALARAVRQKERALDHAGRGNRQVNSVRSGRPPR